jgi:hypothetical protein
MLATITVGEKPFCLVGFIGRDFSRFLKISVGGGGWVRGFSLFYPNGNHQP